MKGSARTQVARSADAVWAMVSDVTRMGSWSPETYATEWLDGATGPAVGVRFKGKNRRGLLRWSTKVRITECEPGRVFGFAVVARKQDATLWTYRFDSTDGGCDVTESYEVLWEPWYGKIFTPEGRRGRQLDEGIKLTLERLKGQAEAGL